MLQATAGKQQPTIPESKLARKQTHLMSIACIVTPFEPPRKVARSFLLFLLVVGSMMIDMSVQAFKAFKAEQDQVTAQLQQRLAAAEHACQERDQTIVRFKEAVGQENGEAAFLSAMQTPEARAFRPSSQGPLSPVQSYAKYVNVVQERNRLKKEYENLQAEWEEVIAWEPPAQ